MKVVILAGGMQSALHNEREGIPKPMVEIGGKPLLWHIMKHFSKYGWNEFIICGGYRIDLMKEYFMDFYIYQSDITVNLQNNTVKVHKKKTEDWKVTVVDTGLYSSTGQRVSMIQKYIEDEELVIAYGDCLSDINMEEMYQVHKNADRLATMAVAKPSGRNCLLPVGSDGLFDFSLEQDGSLENGWVNADCFILRKEAFVYLQGNYDLEKQLIPRLSEKKQLGTYRHTGYWSAIETNRDLTEAENLWNAGIAPWI
ncbi:MAG: NTP transferase domain-containing protein [Eubacterium sp.]|nr:NTP transferase domain-containing protein [Eubacterium sp.]